MNKETASNVFDVSKYILNSIGPISAMKLEKLAYYCQAWSIVWDERPMFNERIEAWASGPVIPDLFNQHRGRYILSTDDINGNPENLDADAIDTINAVIEFYGNKTAQVLSDLTHSEDPWLNARGDLPDGVICNHEITLGALEEYYSSISQ